MTDLSLAQAREFLQAHGSPDIADVGGWPEHDGLPARRIYNLPELDVCRQPLPARHEVILCMDTLEHVRWPWRAAQTVQEALKPGGWLFCTAPWIWNQHEFPIDFWRFSDGALAELFYSLRVERAWMQLDPGSGPEQGPQSSRSTIWAQKPA